MGYIYGFWRWSCWQSIEILLIAGSNLVVLEYDWVALQRNDRIICCLCSTMSFDCGWPTEDLMCSILYRLHNNDISELTFSLPWSVTITLG